MGASFIQLLIFGIAAAAANVLGGLILFPPGIHKNLKKLLKYILALGAGFMLSVVFIDILPEVVTLWQEKSSSPGTGNSEVDFGFIRSPAFSTAMASRT